MGGGRERDEGGKKVLVGCVRVLGRGERGRERGSVRYGGMLDVGICSFAFGGRKKVVL